MAHESFEDNEAASVLNRGYISIKVDREERPDIDSVYMAVCQMFTGAGGWPLTIIMTPDQKPFWAGTYLPKTTSYGRMGLIELLGAVKQLWENNRDELISKGEQVKGLLAIERNNEGNTITPGTDVLNKAVEQYKRSYDTHRGGFGAAPKFPTPHNLLFLLQYSLLGNDTFVLQMATHTLTQMFRGGIFDHIGGGFSRYSTDEKWLVPHFEKMLYDNALITLAYLDAYHITKDNFFSMVAKRTLDYALNELRDINGGFYCGQDADSDGIEGKYYVFTMDEILDVLGSEDGAYFCDWFGVTGHGNFEGKNILNLLGNLQYAKNDAQIVALSKKLYDYRFNRTALHKDDKELTSWNALMILALARAGWLLGNPIYTKAAKDAERFIEKYLTDENHDLKLRYRGEAANDGQLDDYAFYALSLIELYKSTYETKYLGKAVVIAERMLHHFWDDEGGGFFMYSNESEQLISRPKETYDGAIPSGNSAAALVLEYLSKLTGEEKWQQISYRQLCFLSGAAKDYPMGYSMALIAISKAVYPSYELVCVTSEKDAPEELAAYLAANYMPNLTVLVKTRENKAELERNAPFTKNYTVPEKGTQYYLCHKNTCFAPVDNIMALGDPLSSCAGVGAE